MCTFWLSTPLRGGLRAASPARPGRPLRQMIPFGS